MTRLTDNDRHFGPITYAPCGSSWRPFRFVFSTGDDDENRGNNITAYAFGYVARLDLPIIMKPYREKHMATSWDAATVARMGRNYYYEAFPREYGFSLSEGFLQLFLGRQTHDSTTTKDWCWHLPWTQWRHVRYSLYTPDGEHFYTSHDGKPKRLGIDGYAADRKAVESCPKVTFFISDYDGEAIKATCHVEEREWRFGEGWFKWLSLFRKHKIRRSLSIEFSSEVGPEKGSWKGGTMGTGCDMQAGETCQAAFRRYCDEDHRSKYRKYRIKFVGKAE